MSEFTADWLSLREPVDAATRSARLAERVADLFACRSIRGLDLACGTGANVRYLFPRLSGDQHWALVDHDRRLLEQVPQAMSSWAIESGYELDRTDDGLWLRGQGRTCRLSRHHADLDGLSADLFKDRVLVTASALLDLVSDRWLHALAAACCRERSTVLFALTYDGRVSCNPKDEHDELIRLLVNRHQCTDKGFGEALGPFAAGRVESCFAELGYQVQHEPSDWVLDSSSCELQRQLIEGWARAAASLAPQQSAVIDEWRTRRLSHVDRNRSLIVVGHQDIAGWLPE